MSLSPQYMPRFPLVSYSFYIEIPYLLGCLLLGTSAGYPMITYFTAEKLSNKGGFGLGGTNASGQVGLS